jgi:hypothetical protein
MLLILKYQPSIRHTQGKTIDWFEASHLSLSLSFPQAFLDPSAKLSEGKSEASSLDHF